MAHAPAPWFLCPHVHPRLHIFSKKLLKIKFFGGFFTKNEFLDVQRHPHLRRVHAGTLTFMQISPYPFARLHAHVHAHTLKVWKFLIHFCKKASLLNIIISKKTCYIKKYFISLRTDPLDRFNAQTSEAEKSLRLRAFDK